MAALCIVINKIATDGGVLPLLAPSRSGTPFLNGTAISELPLGRSRCGRSFNEIRNESGQVVGDVQTLREITHGEAAFAGEHGWDGLVARIGPVDARSDSGRRNSDWESIASA